MKLYVTFGYRPATNHIDDEPKTVEVVADIPDEMVVTYWGMEMDSEPYADTRETCQWSRPDVCGFVNIENCRRHGTPLDLPKGRLTILRQPLSMHSTAGRIHTMCGNLHNLTDLVQAIETEANEPKSPHPQFTLGMRHAAHMVQDFATPDEDDITVIVDDPDGLTGE